MFGGSVLSYLSWQQDKTYPGVAKFGIALEWGSRGRWFESSHSDHVGASCVSLAPTFFKSQSALTPLLLLSKSQPLTLGYDLGPPLRGGFFLSQGNIDFNRPFHAGAKRTLRRHLFMPGEKDVICPLPCSSFPTATRCVGLAVGVLPCGPHPNISGSSRIRQRCKRKSSQFCRRSSTLSWAIRLLDRRFSSVIN